MLYSILAIKSRLRMAVKSDQGQQLLVLVVSAFLLAITGQQFAADQNFANPGINKHQADAPPPDLLPVQSQNAPVLLGNSNQGGQQGMLAGNQPEGLQPSQRIGNKVYTAQELQMLEQELAKSNLKQIENHQNPVFQSNNQNIGVNNQSFGVNNQNIGINNQTIDVNNQHIGVNAGNVLPDKIANDNSVNDVHVRPSYYRNLTQNFDAIDSNKVPAYVVNSKRREALQPSILENKVVMPTGRSENGSMVIENIHENNEHVQVNNVVNDIKEEIANVDSDKRGNAMPAADPAAGVYNDQSKLNDQRVFKDRVEMVPSNRAPEPREPGNLGNSIVQGAFDVAQQASVYNDAARATANNIPANVHIIGREKDPVRNEIPEANRIPSNLLPSGNVNRFQGNVNGINAGPVFNQRNGIKQEDEEKPGSMKVIWDWSDFATNFEQYIQPEQKIRRAPHATTGEPWPMPQYYVAKKDKVYVVDKTFKFEITKNKCDIIEKALDRYKPYIVEDAVEDMYDNFQHAQSTQFEDPSLKYENPPYADAPVISKVLVKILKPCVKYPHAKMDESYDLFVKQTGIQVWANEVWGALRGLETLSQIIFKGSNQLLYVRDTIINDYPRFTHRGLLIDSSRHFLFKETIYDVLEAMSQNKMNVLHWHIVDDQSFPFYSQSYPDLSAKGAFHPTFVYMPEDVADIIEFARLRGIRVEPEFDTPGHTYSWGLSRPDILTQCYQGNNPVDGYLGPLDPSKNETFRFLKNFFKDVLHVFKDEYLHIGGDEVPMTCWQSNPEVTKFQALLDGKSESNMQTNSFYYGYDIRKVLEYYVTRLVKDIQSLASKRSSGLRLVFWQEIMNNNVKLPNDSIIQVWLGGMEEVERAISLGMNVIYSTCWYINYIEYGTKWIKYYQCDPADSSYGFRIDESKVLGGEACLWGEYLDNENYMTTLWPAASAAAERLWSSKDVRDIEKAATRLQEHRCRMLGRGLPVSQISGPDYCLRRGRKRHQENDTMATNCTASQCTGFGAEKSRVEVENIKVDIYQKGGHMPNCSQAVFHMGNQWTVGLLVLALVAVAIVMSVTRKKISQVRVCKNKTILLVFIMLIFLYFMCSTSIWMQAIEFKGSIEKHKSSNLQST
ncbi:uncharacterized protein LOC127844929 isoform X1 [Dreissena polymorpha]|uniref:uncharacterized protein LOC127844929 isoform X1 n=2 Tax=Dreissena polymorpha TaxID=45954 RepID=UPI00226450AE|nr:uncharacterized protein LOC127844929 isoform X1 [Dreissena polymorpha]